MKRILSSVFGLVLALTAMADGWPANYNGVMLQGFFWDSFSESKWTALEAQTGDFAGYFDLVWVPQSGKCLENYNTMGYTPYYYFNQNSSFGTEAELRSMIGAFKAAGIGTVADVVVNHHNTTGWFAFPAETYGGNTYQLLSTDICANDDGGQTATQAASEGVQLGSHNDDGEDWGGMRDLDHRSANVQRIVKAYEKYLLDDLGYSGFRYDMVKGFAGEHVGNYNDAAGVKFSVGEYWDGNAHSVRSWIDATGKRSAAFDFAFRYAVRNAINGSTNGQQTGSSNWSLLSDASQATGININNGAYKQWAVTFVENHDTQYRSATEQNDPLRKDTLAANAFMLAMPGTPCVFYSHYRAYGKEIKAMIDARKIAGITNMSNYTNYRNNNRYYANTVDGTRGKLLVIVGSDANSLSIPANRFVKVLSGYHYAYYLSPETETAWVDLPSGTYEGAQKVTLTAVSATAGAKLVYTTDGTNPTASSTQAQSGETLTIPAGTTTLKVGLLIGSAVSGIVTRQYNVRNFSPYEIKVYVNADDAGPAWSAASTSGASPAINFWIWGGSHSTVSGSWPGDKVTDIETRNGKKWFVKSFNITTSTDVVNFVFSVGSGTPQTVDVLDVKETSFFNISNSLDGSKYKVNVTTGINRPQYQSANSDPYYYTLSGQRLLRPAKPGVYIYAGKKIIVR